MFKKILCAVDGSQNSLRAAKAAAETAKQTGGTVTLVVVAKPVKLSEKVKEFLSNERIMGEPTYVLEPMTEAVIAEAREAASAAGVPDPKTQVTEGPPARTIVEIAKVGKFDSIFLGSRGLGDLESALLGSVSHKVASLAPCSVVLVR